MMVVPFFEFEHIIYVIQIISMNYWLTGSTGSWINVATRSVGFDLLGFSQWWVVRVAFFLK
jgi:hypothetical protein